MPLCSYAVAFQVPLPALLTEVMKARDEGEEGLGVG